MITVVGGTYDEYCFEPHWKQRFGSGLRACWAINTLSSNEEIEFFTFADHATTEYLKLLQQTLNLKLHVAKIEHTIRFFYDHPLTAPRIYPRGDTINKGANNLKAKGENILYYGFLEGIASVKGKKVVYDPQSPVIPIPFSKTSSTADSLAYVINFHEAKLLSGVESINEIKEYFFAKEQAQILILKMGPKGALVATSDDREILIPVYKTKSVWPIGSGDIFAAVFAYYWFKDDDPFKAAEKASWQTASYCNTKDFQFSELNSNSELIPLTIKEYPLDQVYLAGPFFTFTERWLINEIYKGLLNMNLKVFSPWHHVGHGIANEVVPKDLDALENSAIVLGVLDGLDSGTLFEIGYAVKKGIPIIGYVENESTESVKMLEGTKCILEKDLTTVIYKCFWKLAENV
jgi:nucleoside 2-deoxyribosyltransferase